MRDVRFREGHREEVAELGLESGSRNSTCKGPGVRGGLMGSRVARGPE